MGACWYLLVGVEATEISNQKLLGDNIHRES